MDITSQLNKNVGKTGTPPTPQTQKKKIIIITGGEW